MWEWECEGEVGGWWLLCFGYDSLSFFLPFFLFFFTFWFDSGYFVRRLNEDLHGWCLGEEELMEFNNWSGMVR